MAQSKFLGLNIGDAGKGVLTAFLAAAVTSIYASLNDGVDFPTKAEWVDALRIGITTALAYIIKNFLTNSDGAFAKKEQK